MIGKYEKQKVFIEKVPSEFLTDGDNRYGGDSEEIFKENKTITSHIIDFSSN